MMINGDNGCRRHQPICGFTAQVSCLALRVDGAESVCIHQINGVNSCNQKMVVKNEDSTTNTDTGGIIITRRLCFRRCLSVCKNFQTDMHEIFREKILVVIRIRDLDTDPDQGSGSILQHW